MIAKRTAVRWKPAEDADLLRMFDVELLGWPDIANALPGRTAAACEMRYYSKLQGARDREPRRTGPKPIGKAKGYWRRPVILSVPLAVAAAPAPAQAPAAPMPMRRVVLTEALRKAAAMQARIETCGDLTRGFFGDPPPGRSALDGRARAASAAVQRPFSIGVSDAG
ncbi:hypothetical protein ACVWXO_008090 [Bradyrhizobium sp. LM2.7]